MSKMIIAKIPLLQRTIYSGFQLKTTVNGFTTVVKSKPLLSLQQLLDSFTAVFTAVFN
jgi:hypothetical protein